MAMAYTYPRFEARVPPQLEAGTKSAAHAPLVIVGAGPIGLAAAIDCAQHGLPVVVLDDDDTVSVGSLGLCYAKRSLEVLERLGAGEPVLRKGVTWNTGRVFHRERQVYSFELLDEPGHEMPGMVNLQQYYLEDYLVERARQLPGIALCWNNKVEAIEPRGEGVLLRVQGPEGEYELSADWVIAADGARSPLRKMLGLDSEGKVFNDRFLIADVSMHAQFPAERWFWFDPPFHPGQSVLLHRQADEVWRIDFQLGADADPELERQPERVVPRIRAMLDQQGYHDMRFDLEWVSVYTFQCRRMRHFRSGRVLFAGDAAHQVSPFGARGANSGLQDVDNLAWKLALVLQGQAPESLLDSYDAERSAAADENIANSTRSTDFITPKTDAARRYREATLQLASRHAFAQALVNSGRLSTPTHLWQSSLNTPDIAHFGGVLRPGSPLPDAPVQIEGRDDWLLRHTGGDFCLLLFTDRAESMRNAVESLRELGGGPLAPRVLVLAEQPGRLDGVQVLHDTKHLAAERCDAQEGTVYLIRPDQHVAARWRRLDVPAVRAALARATGH